MLEALSNKSELWLWLQASKGSADASSCVCRCSIESLEFALFVTAVYGEPLSMFCFAEADLLCFANDYVLKSSLEPEPGRRAGVQADWGRCPHGAPKPAFIPRMTTSVGNPRTVQGLCREITKWAVRVM